MKTLDQILSSSWVRTKIGEEIELPYGKGLPGRERIEGQYKVYGSNGVVGTHHDFLIEGPGIIVGRKGTVGAVNYCKENFWPIDTTYYVKTKKENRIRFWYYLLQMLELEDMNTHSAVPGLNRELVYQISIIIPEVSEQKTIEEIFGSLDDKIELNQRINQTLESLAHSLFHSCFVRFDPFQDGEFIDSELGLIPQGWKVQTVKELIKDKVLSQPKDGNHGELHPKHGDFTEYGVPFIMAKDLDNDVLDTVNCKFISEVQAKSLRKGFAIEGDVLISHKATIGRTVLVPKLKWDFILLTPQVTYYRVLNKEILSNLYLLSYFRSNQFQQLFKSWARKGSTRLYLGITDQQNLPLLIPDQTVLNRFHGIVYPIFDRIKNNTRENAFLSSLRDLLLPQLLSGKLRIKNPELFLEEINNEN